MEARGGNGDIASLARLAAELVALRPDILIGIGSSETKAFSQPQAKSQSSSLRLLIPSAMASLTALLVRAGILPEQH